MIRFFRSIRQRLLAKNRFTQYVVYAIGEIALVMIGILLALQVNNWNEERKQQESLKAIYLITKEDLRNDIVEIDSFLKDYEEKRKPAFEAVLNTKLTKEDWSNNPTYKTVLFGFKDFAINQRGFELLKSQSNQTVEQNLDSEIILFYNRHNIEIEVGVKELGDEFSHNLKKLKKYDWFSSYQLHGEMDGAIDYIMNDPIAKNDITLYYLIYAIYVEELRDFKTNGEELIRKIDDHISADKK
ncbi:DUF6090 family protein [Cryomorphaceae bacterium 1068]|nr:DUF6090 family protein [Cryomorphaceae bacterium 1068]